MMKRSSRYAAGLSLCFFWLNGYTQAERSHYSDWDLGPVRPSEADSRTQGSPSEYLEWLCSQKPDPLDGNVVVFWATHYVWIHAEDIPALINSLDSSQRCPHVMMSKSSYRPPGTSTKGHQAAFLIEGFRNGRYPPEIGSSGFLKTKENRYRFDEWVDSFKKYYGEHR